MVEACMSGGGLSCPDSVCHLTSELSLIEWSGSVPDL